MTEEYVPGAVSRILGGGAKLNDTSLATLFSPSDTPTVRKKCSKKKKGTIESAVSRTSVLHKRKKRGEKKVELIDDLENKYEAKIARLHEEAELPVSDVGAKNPKKRKKNKLQTIDDENHVEEKKTKLQTETDGSAQTTSTSNLKNSKECSRPRRDRIKRDPDKENRTVFVGNLSTDATSKTVKKLFKKYGEIESLRFRCAAPADLKLPKKAVVVMKAFHEDRHNINCYVVFKEEKAAKDALKENGTRVKGLHIRVDLSTNATQHQHRNSVFVGNMPFNAEEEQVREHFEDCGEIQNVRLIRDRKTQLGKGIGYVLFEDKSSVELALKLDAKPFCGRQLRVRRSTQQPKVKEKEKGDKKKTRMKKKAKKSDVQGNFQGIKAQKFKKNEDTKSGHFNKKKAKKNKPKHIRSSKIGARNRISKKMNGKKKNEAYLANTMC